MQGHRTSRLCTASAAALAAALTLTPGAATATNGYFTNGTSPQSKAMAGAAVAVPGGVVDVAANPALATGLGNAAQGCLSLFAPDRGATVGAPAPLTPGTYESENAVFPIPCLGSNYDLGGGRALSFTVSANGGLNTEYDTNPFAGLGAGSTPVGVNLEQLFIATTYAVEVSDTVSLGVAPTLAVQRFSATGLEAFAGLSGAPTLVTNNGDDWSLGVGLNLGLTYAPSERWSFGAAYRTKFDMDEFDRYAGLFAEQGDFDIPAMITLGAAYSPDAALTVTAEYQRIFYGDIASIANSNTAALGPLGSDAGPGFGWDDMDVYRLAAIYDTGSRWTFRGGVSYATEFAEPDEVAFNILAPATPQWHIAIGADYALSDAWSLNGAYVRTLEGEIDGTAPLFGGQPVSIRMDQHEVTLGATYRW